MFKLCLKPLGDQPLDLSEPQFLHHYNKLFDLNNHQSPLNYYAQKKSRRYISKTEI